MKATFLITAIWAVCFFPAASPAHEASKPKNDARKGGPSAPGEAICKLRIELRDLGSGDAIPGMIRLIDASGEPVAIPELLDRCVGLPGEARKLGWHVLWEPATISAPRSEVTMEAVSGLERSAANRKIDLKGKTEESVSVSLTRFWNAAGRGLVAGNTHVHLKDLTRAEADRYLLEVPRADGLDVVFVSYLERALVDRTYITNRHTRADLAALSTKSLRFGNGEEYRHNFGGGGEGYGHVMFLDLPERIEPASVGPGITKQGTDGIPLRPGIENARSQGASVVWCHNGFGHEDIPSWTAGLLHAQNIFDGGNRGSYEDSFYRYLNIGMRVPFSTGTDWFIYDYSRVYADLRGNEPTPANWLEALRAGRTFITNGPLLEILVDGKGPGEEIESTGEVEIRYRAVGRRDPGEIQLLMNGKAADPVSNGVRTERSGWFQEVAAVSLKIDEPTWIALRVSPETEATNEFGRKLFAHTSPVYVSVDGKGVFQPETAKGLIAEIEADLLEINKNGSFGDATERNSVEKIYRSAIEWLKRRLAEESR